MAEIAMVIFKVDLMEVVHVQLPDERGESIVPEIFGKDDLL